MRVGICGIQLVPTQPAEASGAPPAGHLVATVMFLNGRMAVGAVSRVV